MAGNSSTSLSKNEEFIRLKMELYNNCLKDVLSKPPPNDGRLYCKADLDLFGCWNYTLAGTRAIKPCPNFPGMNPNEFATKDCTENGTWWIHPEYNKPYANYESCRGFNESEMDQTSDYQHVYIFIAGYCLSIVMLITSLFIFFKFRQLRCDRITIHKNLFISYIATGLLWILYLLLVALNGDILQENPVWCQAIHVLAQYAVVCNFAWMFCEGLYLHTVMTRAFTSGKWIITTCYITGWGVPAVLTAIYTGVRATNAEQSKRCWIHESSLQWIMYAPIVLSMTLNLFFLCNIVRLLITKLRQIPEAAQTRKAARATLILIPLLGLQLLLFPIRPDRTSNLYDVYQYAIALVVSLQGAFVSTMYCFCNGEVLSLLKRKWNQHNLMFGGKRSRAPSSVGNTTSYTLVDHVSGIQTSVT